MRKHQQPTASEDKFAFDLNLCSLFYRILCAMLFVGLATSLKRLWLAFSLGKRSYAHYGPELEVILGKMLLVSQVAHLARQIEAQVHTCISPGYAYTMRTNKIALPDLRSESEDEVGPSLMSKSNDELSQSNSKGESPQNGFGQSLLDAGIGRKFVNSLNRPKIEKTPSQRNLLVSTKQLGSSAKLEIMALLEEWEEPTITANAKVSQGTTRCPSRFVAPPVPHPPLSFYPR